MSSASSAAVPAPGPSPAKRRKVIGSSLVGTSLEWYDFFLYGTAAWIWAYFPLLDSKSSSLIILAAVGGLVCHAAVYGPQAAFITETFGTEVRYSGASLGYQLAGVLGGALAPIIAVALLNRYDWPLAVSAYVAGALCVTVAAVLVSHETAAAANR